MMGNRISQFEITEILYESRCTLVCRGRRIGSGEAVVLKVLKPDTVTKDEVAHFKSEFNITSRISLPGVVKVFNLEEYEGLLTMVMEDIGGESLERLLGQNPLPLSQFLELAIGLADTVSDIHQLRIIHKDINPAHIVCNPETGQFRLIDFGIADELPQRTVALQPPTALEGTLAYISPEQTGRMNRAVDYRTDFYSLGITFYQMLTGKMPFEAEDALGMVHCHIAGTPIPPYAIDPGIPKTVSLIVMKLMAKMAEDRYQSGRGLKADLDRCLRELVDEGIVLDFELGMEDFSDRLQMPQKLYGRENEADRLLAAFERASVGSSELVLVAGYAGVGKTALVHETYKAVLEKRGHFIEGKFDQLQRNEPYFGWTQAFEEFANYLLRGSENELAQWKRDILCAVRNNGRVLTDVIPKLELIIGPQPAVPELSGMEAQNRFNYVLLEFVKVVAASEHPLVVFLDDLQWIDAASLGLLQTLLTSSISNILLIGAYRDNEVDSLHPLMKSIDLLLKEQAKVDLMTLGNLSEDTVNELITDALHCELSHTAPLTRLIYSKTAGNAFFTLQTLITLAERQSILFDVESHRWQWDISALRGMEITDNVVALMLGKIQKMPLEAQHIVPLAACIGFRFTLSNLSTIAEQSEEVTLENLQPALREGLIIPLNCDYQFVHDRVQQAAYLMIPDAEKKSVHLKIGRLIRQQLSEYDQKKSIFAIVDHLNRGSELMETAEERLTLAHLDLDAGQKAKSSAAFSAAAGYIEAGILLLDSESWNTQYGLTLALYTVACEVASLTGEYEKAGQIFLVVTKHAKAPMDMVGVYEAVVHSYILLGRSQDAIATTMEYLEVLGLNVPAYPTEAEAVVVMEQTREAYAGMDIEELAKLPKMTDALKLAIMRIAGIAFGPAYTSRPSLFLVLLSTIVRLSIKYGNTNESAHSYGLYGGWLCSIGDINTGHRFGQLAMALSNDQQLSRYPARAVESVAGHIRPFKESLRAILPELERGYQLGLETGDFSYAGGNEHSFCVQSYCAGRDLRQLDREMACYEARPKRFQVEVTRMGIVPFRQSVANLLGESDAPTLLNGACCDERSLLPILEQMNHTVALASVYLNKLILCYLFGNYEKALENSELAEKNKDGLIGIEAPVRIFYDSLTRLQLYLDSGPPDQERILQIVSDNQRKLKLLADHAPMNMLHKFYLVEAECARVTGQEMAALDCYNRAISLAKENQYTQEEALGNELAGRFWLDKGQEDIARLYMGKARNCYDAWGAKRKVQHLEEQYSRLLEVGVDRGDEGISSQMLDISTVMKAAYAISSEMEMGRLLEAVMRIVIENTGAQSGFLILKQNGEWEIVAKGQIDTEVETPLPVGIDEGDLVSLGVVRFVARTKELVVLEDAATQGNFVNDLHIDRNKTKSLLCAPLLSRGKLVGVLYLENNLITRAFTSERVQLLEMLLSQVAISLENAQIYESLRESEIKYRRIVDTASEGVWALGPDGITTFVNTRMAEMFGYSCEEMIGRPMTAFIFEGEMADHDRKMEDSRQGISENFERGFRRKDGQIVWTLVSSTPIFSEEHRFDGSFAMFTDITERKQAEEALHRLNRELRAISNCNQTLMRAEDEQKLITDICRIVCEEAGYRMAWVGYAEHDEAKTIRPVVWAGFEDGYLAEAKITWADSERGRGPTGTAFRSGKSTCIQDFTAAPLVAPWREGALQRGYRSNIALPLKDENEKPFGVLTIYSTEPYGFTPAEIRLLEELAGDLAFGITVLRTRAERKRAEEAMKEAKEAAESANRAKDQFLAVLSHELRTPLTPVLATVSARQSQEDLPEELRVEMDLIRRNVEMEAKLIDDLLDLTKINRGKLELHPEVVDVHLLLQTALEICQKDIGAKSIEVTLSLQANPHHVWGDATRLRQVFWNLLKNAAAFTRENGQIRLRTSNADGKLKIEVEDNGIGIRPDLLPRIFRAFERGDQESTTTTRFGGLGLGLNIAKTVVEMHHGSLTAFSEGEGKGATFTVELPSVAPVSAEPPPLPPAMPHAEHLGKILLVDDHPDTLQTMSKLLRKWGYVIVTADCVRAALDRAAGEKFDLLISDLGLPDGSGLDIIRKVKPLYTLRGIALSGYGTEEDMRRSKEAGFEEHLTKPVSFQDLRNTIRRITTEIA